MEPMGKLYIPTPEPQSAREMTPRAAQGRTTRGLAYRVQVRLSEN